jgi:uncharacterized delta-60 repeat protein
VPRTSPRRTLLPSGLLLVVVVLLFVGPARATPGTLDPTFGRDGKVTTEFGSSSVVVALALQPDGKIIAAGSSEDKLALARYGRTGSLDPSFGEDGKVTTALGARSWAGAVALQPDGKILAAGSTVDEAGGYQFAVVRYRADGSLDPSFGAGGAVTTPFGPGVASASALVLTPDGRIVAAGRGNSDFALARYEPDGSLDPSFGTGGKVTTEFDPDEASAEGVAEIVLQPDGKIVAAGTTDRGNDDFALARYDPDGALDTGFGTGGRVTTAVGPNHDFASSLALRPDGKLVVAGFSQQLSGEGFALARYNPDGSLDEGFGKGTVPGKVPGTVTGPASGWAEAMVLQPDGKILAAGWIYSGRDVYDFGLVRYKANGSLDAGFGKRGIVTTSLGPGSDYAYALALQPNGRAVAAGMSSHPGSDFEGDFALARYLGGNAACLVPRVTGTTLALARRSITNAGCSMGAVKTRFSQTVMKGHVISQSPAPGARRAKGARVDLVVSKGRKKG